jgi:hypothetical protein
VGENKIIAFPKKRPPGPAQNALTRWSELVEDAKWKHSVGMKSSFGSVEINDILFVRVEEENASTGDILEAEVDELQRKIKWDQDSLAKHRAFLQSLMPAATGVEALYEDDDLNDQWGGFFTGLSSAMNAQLSEVRGENEDDDDEDDDDENDKDEQANVHL